MNSHQSFWNIVFMITFFTTGTATADWCSGDKYGFWSMSVSEQIQMAGKTMRQMQNKVQLETLRLKLDVEPELMQKTELIKDQRQTRIKQTENLCKQASASAYPIYFEGMALKTPVELVTKLKLEMAQLRSLEDTLIEMQAKQLQIDQLRRALKDHTTALELNIRQQSALLKNDVQSEQVQHYLVTACAVRGAGYKLLQQSRMLALEGSLQEVNRKFNQPVVNEFDVQQFLTHCRIKTAEIEHHHGSPWVEQVMDSVKTWF